jgi:hypothetical protein
MGQRVCRYAAADVRRGIRPPTAEETTAAALSRRFKTMTHGEETGDPHPGCYLLPVFSAPFLN